MFDAFVGFVTAWNRIGLAAGGLLCLLIGGALVADFVWWRVRGRRVRGRIVAVRAAGVEAGGPEPDVDRIDTEETVLDPEETRSSFGEAFRASPFAGIVAIVVVLMLIGIPLVFVGVGAYFGYDYLALKATGVETTATVVRNEKERCSASARSSWCAPGRRRACARRRTRPAVA